MNSGITPVSRRHFIATAGAAVLATRAPSILKPTGLTPGLAFAASCNEIQVYSTQQASWTLVQTLPSEAPISLVTDPSTHTLHVLQAVSEHRGLPRGYIESFRIDKAGGHLKPLSIQPLSLSAIRPSHMALSDDGKTLAVAIRGGAAYNLLPILKDGRPRHPIAIRKETGLNKDLSSAPSHIGFNSAGDHIFVLDQGTATISVLSAQNGLPVLSRLSLPECRSMKHLEFHADSNLLFAVDAVTGSLLIIQYDPVNAQLSLKSQALRQGFIGPLAIHIQSKTLFAAAHGSIHRFRLDKRAMTGNPRADLFFTCPIADVRDLVCDHRNNFLCLAADNGIYRFEIDPDSGDLSRRVQAAPGAQRIALL